MSQYKTLPCKCCGAFLIMVRNATIMLRGILCMLRSNISTTIYVGLKTNTRSLVVLQKGV
jgi:hypothetical protein